MKFIALLLCLLVLSCGKSQKIDDDTDYSEFFISELIGPQRDISDRYICRKGWFIERQSFSADELKIIYSGFDFVNGLTNRPGLVHETNDESSRCRIIKNPDLYPGTDKVGQFAVTGTKDDPRSEISIAPELPTLCSDWNEEVERTGCYFQVILHELGHSFRLNHVPDGTYAIMSAIQSAFTWQQADQALCFSDQVCYRSELH